VAALGTRRGVACAGWFEGLFGADQLTNGGQTADDVECGRRRRVMGWRVLGGSRVGRLAVVAAQWMGRRTCRGPVAGSAVERRARAKTRQEGMTLVPDPTGEDR
jgi:hypothetical protein